MNSGHVRDKVSARAVWEVKKSRTKEIFCSLILDKDVDVDIDTDIDIGIRCRYRY
jgi:hypothetical protein